jgi:hypothetical protein
MLSYPPIRVRVTYKLTYHIYPKEDKEKFYAELPPIRVRVTYKLTYKLTYPPLSERG